MDAGAPPATPPRWDYFEHGADIGVIGRGASPERAFEAAAAATFAIMTQSDAATGPVTLAEGATARSPATTPGSGAAPQRLAVDLAFEEADLELALVRWLNALLAAAREHGLALDRFALKREGAQWQGRAWGSPWREDQERGTEVKGATLTALRVGRDAEGWEARCVVDV